MPYLEILEVFETGSKEFECVIENEYTKLRKPELL